MNWSMSFFDELGFISYLLLPRFLYLRGVEEASPNADVDRLFRDAWLPFFCRGASGAADRIGFCKTFGSGPSKGVHCWRS